jgi:8-oxo-dGTP pyrophosphatase MutT (NUDIX family)
VKSSSRQVGALCFRRAEDGRTQILLVTSRGTGRWVIPKGWPSKQLKDHQAAAREAEQEAGVCGSIRLQPIGNYTYLKQDGTTLRSLQVAVFALAVSRVRRDWRERGERQRAWFSVEQAADEVGEPELRKLIRSLDRSPGTRRRAWAHEAHPPLA